MSRYPYKTSFWASPDVTPQNPLGAKEITADVAVIGGGFAGMSAAYYLKKAKPDLNVVLIEQQHVGFGPSGRNFGGVVPGVRELRTSFVANIDMEEERFATRWYLAGRDELERRIAEGGFECEYRNEPLLMQALDADAWQALQRESEILAARGTPHTLLDADAVRRAQSFPYDVAGGLVLTAWRAVQPFKLCRGFGEQLTAMGVAVFEGTPASEVTDAGGQVTIKTAGGGVIKAGKAVLATNAYTQHLKAFEGMIFPRHTYVVATEVLDDAVFNSLGYNEYKFAEDVGLTFYYSRVYKGRLLFGGGMPTKGLFTPSTVDKAADTDETEFDRVYGELQRRFPQLKGVTLEAAWAGPIDMTDNFTPLIRSIPSMPNVVSNIGYNGEGLLGGSISGKMVVGQVLGPAYVDQDAERVRQYLSRS